METILVDVAKNLSIVGYRFSLIELQLTLSDAIIATWNIGELVDILAVTVLCEDLLFAGERYLDFLDAQLMCQGRGH